MSRIPHTVSQFTRSTFSSLAIRNYRLYFIGQGISLSGTWMQTIGQSWLVLELTGSGAALGMVTACQFLPILLFGPLGGVLADHVSKRRLLFITQTCAGMLALILGVLVATHLITLWMVYVLAASLGLVNAVDNPTRQSFIFELAGGSHVGNAVTLNSTEVNLARVVGPALAGALIATIGLAPCFFINAASYVAVLVCLFLLDRSQLHRTHHAKHTRGRLMAGLKYIYHTPILRDTLMIMAIAGTFTYEFQISLAILAKYTFASNAGGYALLTSGLGLGSVIGGIAIAGRRRSGPQGLNRMAMGLGLAVLLAAISPTLALAAGAMVIVGIFSIRFTSLGNTILQLESDPAMRSRVMSFWSVAFLGSTPIGGPIVGWIGEHISPRWGLGIGGIAALAAGILGMIVMKKYAGHTFRERVTEPLAMK